MGDANVRLWVYSADKLVLALCIDRYCHHESRSSFDLSSENFILIEENALTTLVLFVDQIDGFELDALRFANLRNSSIKSRVPTVLRKMFL